MIGLNKVLSFDVVSTGLNRRADLGTVQKARWPWTHQTNRPWQDAQLNSSHLMAEVSDEGAKKNEPPTHKKEDRKCSEVAASHLSVAECDGARFVKRSLKCKGTFQLFSKDSHALPLDHKHLTWNANWGQTHNWTILGTRGSSNVVPSSKYCTVESLESLGSKSAIRGAMYCVAVSIRWVMSPVKMNPEKKNRPDGDNM